MRCRTLRRESVRSILSFLAAVVLALGIAAPVSAEPTTIRVSRQPGLLYLPMMIIEDQKLLEAEARKHGLPDITVQWMTFNSGGAGVDAVLSGNVDFVMSGATNLLVVWDKTHGGVKGVVGGGALPMLLVTRNPNVHSLKDFAATDKIAVPTVRVSTQATILDAAAQKAFGDARKLDPITVALGHPDAYIALASGKEIDAHFSLPPYQEEELKLPGVHEVLSSVDVMGGPVSNGLVFASQRFHDANPKTVATMVAAMGDAIDLIKKNKRLAAEIYLRQTHEKLTADQIVAMLSEPNFVYSTAPQATMKLAEAMLNNGAIKTKPASWKDYFFPEVYNTSGS
jgi:NitT/TauT family transport system substrate-binding protein